MEGIEFEKEVSRSVTPVYREVPKKSWAIRLVMKLSGGRVKNDSQASYILFAVVILLAILSIYNFTSSDEVPKPSKAEILKAERKMQEQLRDFRNR